MSMLRTCLIFAVAAVLTAAVATGQPMPLGKGLSFQLFGGVGVPTGDFASTTAVEAGGAVLGFTVGAELDVALISSLSWIASISYATNGVSDDLIEELAGVSSFSGDVGSWSTIWPMTGVKYTTTLAPMVKLYWLGQLGVVFGSSPDADISSGGVRFSSKSFSSSAVAYAFGAGVLLGNRVSVGIRYITAQPQYDFEFTASAPGFQSTYTGTSDQPTAMIQLLAGFSF